MSDDDCEGCSSPEVADTGGAMVGCLGWALALLVASLLVWGAMRVLREDTPPRNPPFSELPSK